MRSYAVCSENIGAVVRLGGFTSNISGSDFASNWKVGGTYEVGLFPQRAAAPLVSSFAETVLDKDSLVISIPFATRAIPPGSYLLGIRLKESEWIYYPIMVE
jgi:hypothetical protein